MKHRCELRSCSHQAFTHASPSHVPLCVSWAFLVSFYVCCLVAAHIEKPWEKLGLSGVSPLAATATPLQQPASSSQSGSAKSFRELPLRYRRKPLDQTEIDYIQVSRLSLKKLAISHY